MEGITVPLTIPGEAIQRALGTLRASAERAPAPVGRLTLGPTNGKRPAPRFAAMAMGQLWAMRQAELEFAATVVMRRNQETPAEYEARTGRPLEGTRDAYIRDRVAVIPVFGGLIRRHMSVFGDVSGGSTLESIREDFQVALASDQVDAILLDVDSPGGAVNGTNELAQAIYEARGQKPILAYSGGLVASAAYWIASAADELVVDRVAVVGSLGTLAIVQYAEDDGTLYFVSSQSPNKLLDPASEEGRASIQAHLDQTAAIFIATAARNRGMTEEAIVEAADHGDCVIGDVAVERGLADRLGSFESAFADLQARRSGPAARSTVATSVAVPPSASYQVYDAPLARPSGRTSTLLADAIAAAKPELIAALQRHTGGTMAKSATASTQDDEQLDETEDEETVEVQPAVVPAEEEEAETVATLRAQLATRDSELRTARATITRLQGDLDLAHAEKVRGEIRALVQGGDTGMRWFGDLDANIKEVLDLRAALGPDHPSFKAYVATREREARTLHEQVLLNQAGTEADPAIVGGGAKAQLEAIAAKIRESETNERGKPLTYDESMAMAMNRNRPLAQQYMAEDRARRQEEKISGQRTTVRERRRTQQQ